MHHSPRMMGFGDSAVHTPQVAVVSGGVESVLTSPSPPGKYSVLFVVLLHFCCHTNFFMFCGYD